jgi:miniconductance mechanosensitive channel
VEQFFDLLNEYPLVATALGLATIVIVAWIADRVAKKMLLLSVNRIVRETSIRFDDRLVELNVFGRLAHVTPAVIIYFGIGFVPGASERVVGTVQNATEAAMVFIIVSTVAGFLTAVGQHYATTPIAQGRPIEAYIQVTKIAMYVVGLVVGVAFLIEESPIVLLGGLGALMAVILLIFRDTILSFVASLQMASYDMLRIGDWIEMSQFGADGDVVELSLHTVKVQNWDKTITAIPTHKLIEQPFRNWRGMTASGGRRIKRSVFVDMASIRFLTDDELDRLENFAVLGDYIRRKREEISEYNRTYGDDANLVVNSRRLTNIGTFRAYLKRYLQNHSKVRQDMTMLVRQLAPMSEGLPIEIYVFTNTTAWGEYEDIQSDIFDHVLSIVSEFGLRVFQTPSGMDLQRWTGAKEDG